MSKNRKKNPTEIQQSEQTGKASVKPQKESASWQKNPLWLLVAGKPMAKVVFYALLFCALYDGLYFLVGSVSGSGLLRALGLGLLFMGLYFCACELWGARPGTLRGLKPVLLFVCGVLVYFIAQGLIVPGYALFWLAGNSLMVILIQLLAAALLLLLVPLVLLFMRALYESQDDRDIWSLYKKLLQTKLKKALYGWIVLLIVLVAADSMLLGPLSLQINETPAAMLASLTALGNPLGYLSVLLYAYAEAGGQAFDLMMLALLLAVLVCWGWQIYTRWAVTDSLADLQEASAPGRREKQNVLKSARSASRKK